MFVKLILLLAIARYTYGQTCANTIGRCVGGVCPAGYNCISSMCCPDNSTVPPATACVNNLNDKFCQRLFNLCNDADIGSQMRHFCPVTCNACNSVC